MRNSIRNHCKWFKMKQLESAIRKGEIVKETDFNLQLNWFITILYRYVSVLFSLSSLCSQSFLIIMSLGNLIMSMRVREGSEST